MRLQRKMLMERPGCLPSVGTCKCRTIPVEDSHPEELVDYSTSSTTRKRDLEETNGINTRKCSCVSSAGTWPCPLRLCRLHISSSRLAVAVRLCECDDFFGRRSGILLPILSRVGYLCRAALSTRAWYRMINLAGVEQSSRVELVLYVHGVVPETCGASHVAEMPILLHSIVCNRGTWVFCATVMTDMTSYNTLHSTIYT